MIRYWLALWMAKLSILALRLTGHRGTNFPGALAIRICPDFLRRVNKPELVIGVTGTNGKTTVSNLARDLLTDLGRHVLNNSEGSNIASGVATSFIRGVSWSGKALYDTAVLEIDERSARTVYPYMAPDWLVVTNLTRDSIMRNGHPEYIRDILTRYMPKKTKLILNADNLICTMIAPGNQRIYYGIDRMETDQKECRSRINDLQVCPECGTRMEYEYVRYSNIGRSYCPGCGFASPACDVHAVRVDLAHRKMTVRFEEKKQEETFSLIGTALFNAYNVLSAAALLDQLGYPLGQIRTALSHARITESRYSEKKVSGVTVLKLLGKDRNAYATSRVLEVVHADKRDKEIFLYNNNLSDAKEWSENTCWLYDCDFELLADDSVRQVLVFGERAKDYKLRLLLAGVPKDRIREVKEPLDGVPHILGKSGEVIYIIYGTAPVSVGDEVYSAVIRELQERGERK